MIKILIAITRLDRGGAEQHLLRVLPRLTKNKFSVCLITMQGGGALEQEFYEKGISISSPCAKYPLFLQRLQAIGMLARHLSSGQYDIAHFFLPEAYILGGVSAVLTRFSTCVMSRRSLNDYQKEHKFAARIERWLHKRMSAITGNSNAVIKQLKVEGVQTSKLHLIHNGISLQQCCKQKEIDDARVKLGIDQDTLVLVIVANLIPYKGHADALQALAQIKNQLPNKWMLLCIGRDDGIGAMLRDNAEDLGIADNVRWLGERTDVPALLSLSDIGLLGSHQEGFSNSLLEYMAASLPVVATDVGGNCDAVVDSVTGLLVSYGKPIEIGQAILKLAADKEVRASMGGSGRRRVEEKYSLNVCVERYKNLYHSMVEQ